MALLGAVRYLPRHAGVRSLVEHSLCNFYQVYFVSNAGVEDEQCLSSRRSLGRRCVMLADLVRPSFVHLRFTVECRRGSLIALEMQLALCLCSVVIEDPTLRSLIIKLYVEFATSDPCKAQLVARSA